MKLFVIIPAFNEGRRIAEVVREVKEYSKNIVVVDDGSKDNTHQIAKKTNAVVLRHLINLGKGAALRTGAEYANANGADAILFIDSDGQHPPKGIPKLAKELENADIVFTYRNFKSAHMPLTKKFGNFFLNKLLAMLFGISLRDAQCGFKIMTKKAYGRLGLISSDYNIESEIAAKTGKYGLRFKQVPIETIYTDAYKGTTVFDGMSIAMRMFWWKLSR
ncbi:glycosyltransferase family 2 protein [Candidatus Woesearchaeota archaeon]|nr:glycosyltransferase family 2 protein [Candidatus Woesearchaeota archaeon]